MDFFPFATTSLDAFLLLISITLVSTPGGLLYLWGLWSSAFLWAGTFIPLPYVPAGC